ncbi:MAG TPA: helix-turn-helix domain-containing protein [Flavobacteriaceae bacterium]|nr:helix-turn-helix domain-containing protein [Flavobacteriaceae bacterium]
MNNIILQGITAKELSKLIADEVRKHLPTQTPTEAEPKEKLLSVKETAEFLGLSTATIYSNVSRGTLPHMKRGNRLYFSSLELMEYIKEGRQKTNADIEAEADLHLSTLKNKRL